jgi:prophage antirepressor-like protein
MIDVVNQLAKSSQGEAMPMEFSYSSESIKVRSFIFDNEPWFLAKDVCDLLGLIDVSMSLQKLADYEKLIQKLFVSGQHREVWLVNESGLYSLIFRSNKPEAKAFQKWVTTVVLPEIRKTGGYRSKTRSNYLPVVEAPTSFYNLYTFLDYSIRCLEINQVTWFNINDILKAAGSRAGGSNKYRDSLFKLDPGLISHIQLQGYDTAYWYTTAAGMYLLLSKHHCFRKKGISINSLFSVAINGKEARS